MRLFHRQALAKKYENDLVLFVGKVQFEPLQLHSNTLLSIAVTPHNGRLLLGMWRKLTDSKTQSRARNSTHSTLSFTQISSSHQRMRPAPRMDLTVSTSLNYNIRLSMDWRCLPGVVKCPLFSWSLTLFLGGVTSKLYAI